jgi:hypothetical protein
LTAFSKAIPKTNRVLGMALITGDFMKRIILISVIAIMAPGLIFAQSADQLSEKAGESERFNRLEMSEISGNLGISHGLISLESGGVVYCIVGLQRFAGFIEELKAGAVVTLEGYVLPDASLRRSRRSQEFLRQNQNPRFFRVTKLSVGGKDYDLSPLPGAERSRRRDFGPPGFAEGPRNWPGQSPYRCSHQGWGDNHRGRSGHREQDWRR